MRTDHERLASLALTLNLAMPSQSMPVRSVKDEADALRTSWSRPRWEETKRPYSAEDVVALRGSIEQTYPADAMSKKLYDTLLECRSTGGHSRTYGALDPVQVTLMAPHLTSIYVSSVIYISIKQTLISA